MGPQTSPPVGIVVYAVGSPVVVDFEESLARCNLPIAAAIRNVEGEVYLRQQTAVLELSAVPETLKPSPFVVPLLTPGHRQRAVNEAVSLGFVNAFTLIDPTSIVPSAILVGAGTYVNAGCVVGGACEFAEFVFVNRGACIGHHVVVESFASIGPGAIVGGMTRVGKGSFIGAGAILLPSLRIGENAVVAAGAVVTQDVPDECLVRGNPARIVKTGIAGHAGQTVT